MSSIEYFITTIWWSDSSYMYAYSKFISLLINQLISQFVESKLTQRPLKLQYSITTYSKKEQKWQDKTDVRYVVRWKQLEMHMWLWVDCQKPMLDDILLRYAVWLLICWINYHASPFVIVLTIHSNYASEYTLDLVQQVMNI